MTDIKDMCDRLVESPPPLRSGDAVLAQARRSAQRHRRGGMAAAGLLTASALAAGGVYAGTAGAPAAGQGGHGLAPAAAATGPTKARASTGLPPARAALVHSEKMRELLVTAVPAGATAAPLPVDHDDSLDPHSVLPDAAHPAPRKGAMSVAGFVVVVQQDGREGALVAQILAAGTPLPRCHADAVTQCATRDVGGVRIEITSWADKAGKHIAASRRLQGGVLVVIGDQGMRSEESSTPPDAPGRVRAPKPPLKTMPFTAEQVAALAANPDMLQFH
ncbi:hypothetical protein [Krasilnikovia sp. MM14-A1004]|uniref:hypothetical protein n=1 Tax=Krasilnikovia sp. MM14-A1004 TaxID=3373541 RepID=UPI00399D24F5